MNQRGGFAMGLVAGLLIGLALALGVALYITKAPVPFINKVPQRTAEQDNAEAERNKTWDPNAALGVKAAARAASAAAATAAGSAPAAVVPPVAAVAPPAAPAASAPAPVATSRPSPPWRDPGAILSGGPVPDGRSTVQAPEPFVYFVQAGAYSRNEDAEQQRARLAMAGLQAKITEREQAGRTMYRVRLGPYPVRNAADDLQQRLQAEGIEAQIVRVEKQP